MNLNWEKLLKKQGFSQEVPKNREKNRKTGHYPQKQENQEKQGKWGHC